MNKSKSKPNNQNDKQNIFIRFWNWGWGIYHKNEEVWNYIISGGIRIRCYYSNFQTCKNNGSINNS